MMSENENVHGRGMKKKEDVDVENKIKVEKSKIENKEKKIEGKDKGDSRWGEGVFLGVKEESGEVIIGVEKGVVNARTFRRFGSEEERWRKEKVLGMKGTPWEPMPGRGNIEVTTTVNTPSNPGEVSEPTMTQGKEKGPRAPELTPRGLQEGP